MTNQADFKQYLALDRLPHLWCPGCGHGTILKAIFLGLAELGVPKEKALLATGIGCSGRAGDYVACHRFQGTHGRTLAFATGIKLARPELTTVCLMGDGDSAAPATWCTQPGATSTSRPSWPTTLTTA